MQSDSISTVHESCTADFKAVESAFISSNIGDEWSVFIGLLFVPRVDVFIERHRELENVQCFSFCILDHNIWLESCHTEGRWYGAPTWCLPTRYITVHSELRVNEVDNEVNQVVVAPGVSASVQHHFATV